MYIPISLSQVNQVLGEQELRQYLKRIGAGYDHKEELRYLSHLHQKHLLSIPFENFDVMLGNRINTDIPNLFDKLIIRKRGGICYELNSLFAWLLQNTFYNVTMLSAGVFARTTIIPELKNSSFEEQIVEFKNWVNGNLTEDYSHLCLLVNTYEAQYLCDVGFGHGFIHPLKLDSEIQVQQKGTWRLLNSNNEFTLQKLIDKNEVLQHPNWRAKATEVLNLLEKEFDSQVWLPIYKFSLKPHKIDDFKQRCNYYTTDTTSTFRQQPFIKTYTENGTASLTGNKLTVKSDTGFAEKELSLQEIKYYLEHIFDFLPSEIEGVTKNLFNNNS